MTPDTLREAVTHPILFTGSMVRAILEDRKSMTRRVMRPQPRVSEPDMFWWPKVRGGGGMLMPAESWPDYCPYGKPGDLLWVRETWMQARGTWVKPTNRPCTKYRGNWITAGYRASVDEEYGKTLKWRPSIHMPRWASRLTLRVSNVRVERVQDICTEDIYAEGAITEEWKEWREDAASIGLPPGSVIESEHDVFTRLWDTINAKRGYSWESNPWVWVIEWDKVWHENVDRVLAGIEEPDVALDLVRE